MLRLRLRLRFIWNGPGLNVQRGFETIDALKTGRGFRLSCMGPRIVVYSDVGGNAKVLFFRFVGRFACESGLCS